MRKYSLLLIVITSLNISICNADMVYKCKNEQDKLMYQKTPCEAKQAVSSWTPKTKVRLPELVKKPAQALVLKQGRGGHYYLDAEVNSHALTFVVDTGATMVSLPQGFAGTASMFCNDKGQIDTANGRANVCTATITELKLGNLVFKNVTALLVPNLSQPLLGMNVLRSFNIEQMEEEMTLSQPDAKIP
ncbi:MAG: TIGR02281 family clan AA aspartic protease [Methylococcales bacterium]|nr:TIGR02281 family clan AA aspartic protease [Methylococcales bacterium]